MIQRRRSITQLTSPKEITDGASRYCLIAQEHDTDGELETKLYKVLHSDIIAIGNLYINIQILYINKYNFFSSLKQGDILPTSGGGAQVVFNDMECLKQSSPKARKRTGPREEGVDQVDTLTETKRLRVISS